MKTVAALAFITLMAGVAAAQAPRVRDSAGVRIVENGPRLKAPIVFRLGDKPTFDAGGLQADPSDEFAIRNGYPAAIRIPNGNVAILDGTRVLFHDASGKRIRSFGRRGRGPGEFDPSATNICATRGDTVLVGQSRRPLNVLTGDGVFVRTIPLPSGTLTEGDICFDDGSFVVMSRVSAPGNPSQYRFTRVAPGGATNIVADHEYPPFDMIVRVENPKVAHGGRMYFANGDRFEIRAYDKTGRLAEIIRTSDAQRPLTDDEKAKLPLLAVRGGASPAEIEEAHRRAIANSKTRFWPTMGRMLVDLSGRIWVQDWAPREDWTQPQGWTAFDATGRMLGRMIIPGTSKDLRRFVVSFGRNEVFFNSLDEDGAVHYVAYPILPIAR